MTTTVSVAEAAPVVRWRWPAIIIGAALPRSTIARRPVWRVRRSSRSSITISRRRSSSRSKTGAAGFLRLKFTTGFKCIREKIISIVFFATASRIRLPVRIRFSSSSRKRKTSSLHLLLFIIHRFVSSSSPLYISLLALFGCFFPAQFLAASSFRVAWNFAP